MKRTSVRCWSDVTSCPCAERVEVVYTVPDFGDAIRLFTCLSCGAVLAVDPDREHYSRQPFKILRQTLNCPECGKSLADAVPYPDTFVCPACAEHGHYARSDKRIPAEGDSIVREFWDPYTTDEGR